VVRMTVPRTPGSRPAGPHAPAISNQERR
jgi:hypothetical protein